ncbi:MAG: DUF3822 family protein [Saprospiraceae bacterium]|jgi:hypothetical protein|nr:DUF3822 family protein [Saprospiraceae bacterium]
MLQRDFDNSDVQNRNKLSVILFDDSFFYAIISFEKELVAHTSFEKIRYGVPKDTESIMSDIKLRNSYSDIHVLTVPKHSFISSSIDEELPGVFPVLESKVQYFEKLVGQDLYHYFGLSHQQEKIISDLFSNSDCILNSATSKLSNWFAGKSDQFIHIHLEISVLIIYIQNNGQSTYYNTFHVEDANDALYFSLAASKSSGINLMTDRLTLSGTIELDSKLYNHLTAYFGNVEIIADSGIKLHSNAEEELKPHYYFLHFLNIL